MPFIENPRVVRLPVQVRFCRERAVVWAFLRRSNGTLHAREQGSTTEVFSYDDFNRLTQALISGTRTLAYQYNDLGNITSKTDTDGDNLTSWSYSGSGPHTVRSVNIGGTTQTYTYDANGNAITARGRTITYNTFNKPTNIDYPAGNAETTFEYGPDQARFRQYAEYTDGGDTYQVETFYVAGGLYEKVITTVNLTTTTSTERCFVGDSYLEVDCGSANPTEYYLLRDHLGSIDSITDDNGTLVNSLAFDPYGLRREADWSEPLPLTAATLIADAKTARGFTHHEHLDRTGFIHMNGRLYDPVIGRFLSADPVVVNPFDSQAYNRYSYVRNSSLSATDPTGFAEYIGPDYGDSSPALGFTAYYDEPWVYEGFAESIEYNIQQSGSQNGQSTFSVYHAATDAFDQYATLENLDEAAQILAPGYDLLVCATRSSCDGIEWTVGVIGIIPMAKLGVGAFKVLAKVVPHLPSGVIRSVDVPVSGTAQVTRRGGVETTHASTSQRIANEQALRTDAASVHLNQTVGTITEGGVVSRVRPDVATVRTDGKIDAFEVLSPGQTVEQQTRKLQQALGNRAGNIVCVACD